MSLKTGGLQGSAYEIVATPTGTPITANTQILASDITITASLLNGDSGLLRLLFSFTTAIAADTQITVTKLGAADLTGSPLILNADNTFIILSDGYYRFDVSVAPGDLINLSSSVQITAVNDLQVQRIPLAV